LILRLQIEKDVAREPFPGVLGEAKERGGPAGLILRHGYEVAQWGDVERGNPLPYTLPPERRREVGLERETWRLEVVADPASNSVLEAPLEAERGTSLDFEALLELGQTLLRYDAPVSDEPVAAEPPSVVVDASLVVTEPEAEIPTAPASSKWMMAAFAGGAVTLVFGVAAMLTLFVR